MSIMSITTTPNNTTVDSAQEALNTNDDDDVTHCSSHQSRSQSHSRSHPCRSLTTLVGDKINPGEFLNWSSFVCGATVTVTDSADNDGTESETETPNSTSNSNSNSDNNINTNTNTNTNTTSTMNYLYGIPSKANQVMKLNPITLSRTLIGPDLGEIGHTQEGKWRTGVLDTHEYTISNNATGAGATDESKRNDSYGIIYCIPYNSQYILTINTLTDHVELLTMYDCNMGDNDKIQKWTSGVQALDGCIYCMPAYASHILKIDPTGVSMDMDMDNNMNMNMDMNEHGVTVKGVSVTSVGMKFEWGWKYFDTILGIDGCIYGIPNETKSIFKYDTVTNVCSIVGGERDDCFYCDSGVLGRGGRFIYALKRGVDADDVSGGGGLGSGGLGDGGNGNGNEVVKIDTLKNQYSVIQVKLDEDQDQDQHNHKSNSNSTNDAPITYYGWKNAVLGNDGCIYFPPYNANRTLKYDPYMDSLPQSSSSSSSNSNSNSRRRSPFSLVGKDFGNQQYKWLSGVSLSAPVSTSTSTSTHQNKTQNRDGNGNGNGATYCIPNRADQIMIIDPYKEFANNLQDRARACTPIEMVRFLFAAHDDYDYHDDDKSQRSCGGEHGCESGVNTITLSTSTSSSRTFITTFESAIQKYGRSNVFHLLDECIAFSPEGSCKGILPSGDKEEHDEQLHLQLPLFMVAASCKHSAPSVIYHFLRKDPSVLVSYIHNDTI